MHLVNLHNPKIDPYIAVTHNRSQALTEQPLNVNIRWFNFWYDEIDGFGRHNENYNISAALFILQFYISAWESAENAPNVDASVRPPIGGLSLATMHSNFCSAPLSLSQSAPGWSVSPNPPTCARTHRLRCLIGRRPSAPDTCDNAQARRQIGY